MTVLGDHRAAAPPIRRRLVVAL